ncbi:MAG TPA: hypothetical protein VMV10_31180 [Pirellulales bacterium]|nr:hypothetical protein [Pirellulales bacterium]HVA50609.1 hypothetical protein [Pirellulales bacterium]HVA50632.1 hypothetical protein [Pirellulales bacterium]
MSPNRKKAVEADSLRAKTLELKKTQRRLLQQLDKSIRSSEQCLKKAKLPRQ